MQDDFVWLKQDGQDYPIVLAQNSDGVIIGWAMAYFDADQWHEYIEVFVNIEYRRRGIGTKLCNSLMVAWRKRYNEKVDFAVFTHDNTSLNFYESLGLRTTEKDQDIISERDLTSEVISV